MRQNNEDCVGHFEPPTPADARTHGWLFVLADGVGGHDRGEVASRAAVEHMVSEFGRAPAGEQPISLLARIVRGANQHVYELASKAAPGGSAMATTVVACALRYDRAAIAHAGDSRCYLVREGRAQVLTRDHTIAQEQARLGILSGGEASAAATKHVLSRSLGKDLFLNVETSEHQILAGDVLVLCCDGLHNSVNEDDLAIATAGGADLRDAAAELVDLAKQRDGSDNISVQLVRIRSVERVGIYRGRPYKLR
jgi:protein phosphatase